MVPIPPPPASPRAPAPPSREVAAEQRPVEGPGRQERNRRALEAYGACLDPASRLRWRNALVRENLPLVRSIVGRCFSATGPAREDLLQVGYLGLIRAVEAFDPTRAVRLSTFAVPYVRGAIRQELRDREHPVRIPRQLWELRQRATGLLEQRRRQGLPVLGAEPLARALNTTAARLEEALAVGSARSVRSLDAPLAGGEGAEGGTLLERLSDPASLGEPLAQVEAWATSPGPSGGSPDEPLSGPPRQEAGERGWLQGRLAALPALERELVVGRLQHGCTWVELGRTLGLHPRQAQRRCEATLAALQEEGARWREDRLREPSTPG